VDLATDSVRAPRFFQPQACYVALSPDGRWLATGGWHAAEVRLWNAETGQMVREWKLFRGMVFFTPDSRALIISQGDELTFWDVETLEQVGRISRDVAQYPGRVAFSRDGRLMALEMAPGIIHLRDAATGRTVARLEDPHDDRAGWMGFTTDGTQLVVAAPYAKAVHVWDLRTIRRRLKGMGLDWEWPEFSPTGEPDRPGPLGAAPTIRVVCAERHFTRGMELATRGLLEEAVAEYRKAIEIDPKHARAYHGLGLALFDQNKVGEAIACYAEAIKLDPGYAEAYNSLGGALHYQKKVCDAIACYRKAIEIDRKHAWAFNNLGVALRELRRFDEAIACHRKAIRIDPKYPTFHNNLGLALNNLAWALATDPEPAKCDPGRAVKLAKEAVEISPQSGGWWNTLGAAYYRARDWTAALEALEQSMKLRQGGESYDWFFLAMAHWQLGNEDEARRWYDRAVEWADKNQPGNEELRRFRAEAAGLMKVAQKK
jgi:tetratricopeptide (TPR) repeat protein